MTPSAAALLITFTAEEIEAWDAEYEANPLFRYFNGQPGQGGMSPGQERFHAKRSQYRALRAANQCLSGDTVIASPDGDRAIGAVREPFRVWAFDGTEMVAAWAYPNKPRGPDPLFEVTLSNGQSFRATAGHRLLGADGDWRPLSELRPGSELARPPSSSDADLSARAEGAPRSSQTPPGCSGRCSADRRPDDEQTRR